MRPCFPLSAVGSGRKTLDRQVWRPRRGSQPRTREASGHRPSLLRGTALQWAGRGRASGRNPALGAPKKPARVAEATVPKPKVATTERRKASALRQGRGRCKAALKMRLSALCPPRSSERCSGGHRTKKFRAARKPIPCVRNQDEAQHEKNSMKRPKPAPEFDGMPEDINEFRRELLQRMNNMLQEWRTCGQTVCRRARKCVAKNLACSLKPAPIDRRKAARAKFLLKRALEARLAACPYDDNEEVKTPVADSGQRASNSAGPHQAPKVRPRSKTTAPAAQAARPPQTKVSRSTELARSRKG